MRITSSVGVRASNERATEGGTWSGIVILNLECWVRRKMLIAMNVTMMPTNRPAEPMLGMEMTKPLTPAAPLASAGTLTGTIVSRNAMTDMMPPDTPSRS